MYTDLYIQVHTDGRQTDTCMHMYVCTHTHRKIMVGVISTTLRKNLRQVDVKLRITIVSSASAVLSHGKACEAAGS